MANELFHNLDIFGGRYCVTSWGRVYDMTTGRFLKPEVTKKGYLRVDLYDEYGKRKHVKVHRLVALSFIENPDGKPQVDHIDGNKQNNSVTNLRWCTDEENKRYQREFCIAVTKKHFPEEAE